MTLPHERQRAFFALKDFVRSLLDPKQTPRVPKALRKEAYWRLKHYMSEHEMMQIVKKHPKLFGELR